MLVFVMAVRTSLDSADALADAYAIHRNASRQVTVRLRSQWGRCGVLQSDSCGLKALVLVPQAAARTLLAEHVGTWRALSAARPSLRGDWCGVLSHHMLGVCHICRGGSAQSPGVGQPTLAGSAEIFEVCLLGG